ncbi:MAG: transporter permease, partial [Rhizobacter sp.]|nr:transporter permease [Rhizobacter sp.]
AALLATLRGFDPPDERLVLLARVLRLSHAGFFFKFALPPAVPYMLSGLRQAFRAALMLALVGEMLASQDGLGTSILQAARSFRSPELFAGVLLLGGIALTGDVALRLVEWVLVRWRHERAVT